MESQNLPEVKTPEVLPRVLVDDIPSVDEKSKKMTRGWLINISILLVFFEIVGGIGFIDFLTAIVAGHESTDYWMTVARHPIIMIIVHALILTIVVRQFDILSERKSKR
jgi:hypothetical protein